MSASATSLANREIEGRKQRCERLYDIISADPGMTLEYYEGKLCRSYCVKQRTFESYMRTLQLEGRVIFNDREQNFWTIATWQVEAARRNELAARREEDRIRMEAGKLEEFFQIPRTG